MKTGMQDSVMNEKNILMMTNSSFITKLWDCQGLHDWDVKQLALSENRVHLNPLVNHWPRSSFSLLSL